MNKITEKIFKNALHWLKLKFHKRLQKYQNLLFVKCEKLTNFKLNSELISIHYFAFKNCNFLIEINISDSVKYIGNYAFQC